MQAWTLSNYLLAIGGLVGALILWAAQVSPEQAVSHVSAWARAFGLREQPHWLKSENADRVIRHLGGLLFAACVIFGLFGYFDIGNTAVGIRLLFGIGVAGTVAAILWNLFFPKVQPEPLHFVIVGLLIAVVAVAWQLRRNSHAPATDTSQIEKKINELTADVTEKDRQLIAKDQQLQIRDRELKQAREHQAASMPPPAAVKGAPIGPITTLQMRENLASKPPKAAMGGSSPSPIDFRWAVIITAPPNNLEFANFLWRLMVDAGLRVNRLEIPDTKELDAPNFSSAASHRAGVTLHGEYVLSKRLSRILPPCITAGITSKTVDGLREWYLKTGRMIPEQQIVWIEIGDDSPWTMQTGCFS